MPARAKTCLALTFERTILKIFWTLIECDVEQKMRGAFIALENRFACVQSDQQFGALQGVAMIETDLVSDFFLFFRREGDEMIILRPDQERDRSLMIAKLCSVSWSRHKQNQGAHFVEPSSLPVPLFDAVQGTLPRQVEHEQDGDRVIADQRKHRDEFALTAEIPD